MFINKNCSKTFILPLICSFVVIVENYAIIRFLQYFHSLVIYQAWNQNRKNNKLSKHTLLTQIRSPATDEEMLSFENALALLDPDLVQIRKKKALTKAHIYKVNTATKYKDFLKKHCFEGHYSFQVKLHSPLI